MRKLLRWLLRLLPWAVLLLITLYLVSLDGLLDLTRGRTYRVAYEFFNDGERLHEAEVFLLKGEPGTETGETFPIKPYGKHQPVYGSIRLTGMELKAFRDVWRWQEVELDGGAMCHHPPYGFRLYRDGKLVRETSLCWQCRNFYADLYPGVSVWYGFDAGSEEAKELLRFCDERLPYYRKPEVEEKTDQS